MNAKFISGACLTLAAVVFWGCPEKESTDDVPKPEPTSAVTVEPAATAVPTASTTASAVKLVPDGQGDGKKPSIEARVKSELDGKGPDADSKKGNMLVAAGAKAAFMTNKTWINGKSGLWSTSTSSGGGKSRFTVGALAPGEAGSSKLAAAAAALSYTDCDWGTPEQVTTGKAKWKATVADGVCLRNGNPVRAAYASFDGQKTLSMGGWDIDGGNAALVFSSFRSVKKVIVGTGYGIAACCAALRQNAASAPLQQKGIYMVAIGACQAALNSPQGRAALGQVRAALRGANVPASCR